jgi:hypothetical protein
LSLAVSSSDAIPGQPIHIRSRWSPPSDDMAVARPPELGVIVSLPSFLSTVIGRRLETKISGALLIMIFSGERLPSPYVYSTELYLIRRLIYTYEDMIDRKNDAILGKIVITIK